MCQCSIMTAWYFSTLPNRLFETSVHIWKYNLSFLCSSFLLKIFFLFLFFSIFLPFFSYGTISVPPAALPRLSLSPLFCGLLVLLPCCLCIFEQLIRTRKGNMIFLFQPIGGNDEELIWPKFVLPRALGLICIQKEEARLTLEVRESSQCRNYFPFINNKGKIKKE